MTVCLWFWVQQVTQSIRDRQAGRIMVISPSPDAPRSAMLETLPNHTISAQAFIAHSAVLLREVVATDKDLLITEEGKLLARLVPLEAPTKQIFGCMAGTGRIVGDIVEPLSDDWTADEGNINPSIGTA